MRCFIAITFDDYVKKQIRQIQKRLQSSEIRASWPAAATFHLTLAFMEEISSSLIPDIQTVIENAAQETRNFNLSFDCLGGFPNTRHPKVIWFGSGQPHPELTLLQTRLQSALKKILDITDEKKGFPHITLARIRRNKGLGSLAGIFSLETGSVNIPVRQIHLVKSQLRPSGAVHTTLFSAAFG